MNFHILSEKMILTYFSSRKKIAKFCYYENIGCHHELCDKTHDHLFLLVVLPIWINHGNLKLYDYHPLQLQNKFKNYENY